MLMDTGLSTSQLTNLIQVFMTVLEFIRRRLFWRSPTPCRQWQRAGCGDHLPLPLTASKSTFTFGVARIQLLLFSEVHFQTLVDYSVSEVPLGQSSDAHLVEVSRADVFLLRDMAITFALTEDSKAEAAQVW